MGIGLCEQFLQGYEIFFKNFDFNKILKIAIKGKSKKYAVDSRKGDRLVLTETSRQRRS